MREVPLPVLTGAIVARCGELTQARCAERDWQVIALEVMPDQLARQAAQAA
ncbi:hypothetical protein [Micromonospora sp. NPDC047740]|uniref:hypothetical protein n=1 Tax=Micromonospora sp. NPDC047740 TaxID=3364254 RepID=UPI00371AFA67